MNRDALIESIKRNLQARGLARLTFRCVCGKDVTRDITTKLEFMAALADAVEQQEIQHGSCGEAMDSAREQK